MVVLVLKLDLYTEPFQEAGCQNAPHKDLLVGSEYGGDDHSVNTSFGVFVQKIGEPFP